MVSVYTTNNKNKTAPKISKNILLYGNDDMAMAMMMVAYYMYAE